jgi:hypothetical protein
MLVLSLVTKATSFARVMSITIEMPIAMAMLKGLYAHSVAYAGD